MNVFVGVFMCQPQTQSCVLTYTCFFFVSVCHNIGEPMRNKIQVYWVCAVCVLSLCVLMDLPDQWKTYLIPCQETQIWNSIKNPSVLFVLELLRVFLLLPEAKGGSRQAAYTGNGVATGQPCTEEGWRGYRRAAGTTGCLPADSGARVHLGVWPFLASLHTVLWFLSVILLV